MTTTGAPSTVAAEIAALLADVAAGITDRDPDRAVAGYAADARTVVTPGGGAVSVAVGRNAIRQAHVDAFASSTGAPPARARFELLDLHLLRPDVAVAITGAYAAAPDDEVDLQRPPTVATWTLLHDGGGWRIANRQLARVP